ncbi:unnamed protein product [Caretta caretta]
MAAKGHKKFHARKIKNFRPLLKTTLALKVVLIFPLSTQARGIELTCVARGRGEINKGQERLWPRVACWWEEFPWQ